MKCWCMAVDMQKKKLAPSQHAKGTAKAIPSIPKRGPLRGHIKMGLKGKTRPLIPHTDPRASLPPFPFQKHPV